MSRPGMMYTLGGGFARTKVGACDVDDKRDELESLNTAGGGFGGRA